MSKLMITCKKATEMIERNNSNDLSMSELMKLKFHLILCKACKFYEKQSRLIDTFLKKHLLNTEKPIDSKKLKHRIKSKIENELMCSKPY